MTRRTRTRLSLETLDARIVPALTILFDYSLDTHGFFNDPTRRAVLEDAAAQLASRLDDDFDAIVPRLGNSWSLLLNSPSSGQQVEIPNPTIAEGTIRVYAGGYDLGGAEAGEGGYGGYKAAGDSTWFQSIQTRGRSGFSLWGGSLAFDLDQNWNFTSQPPAVGQIDFFTTATHELGHLLGFGTAEQYFRLVSNGHFIGANAIAANGGTAPRVSAEGAHWAQGTESHGEETSLQPMLVARERYGFSELDYAVLQDIGWGVSGSATSPPAVTAPIHSETPGTPVLKPLIPSGQAPITSDMLAIGQPDGSVRMYRLTSSGETAPVGEAYYPFGGSGGSVRTAVADVTGDGTPDLVFAAGAGGGSQIRVIDGSNGTDIGGTFSAFEPSYTGGLFLATADLNHDGRADVIVSPDRGGGGRVTVFSLANGKPLAIANFFGIEDARFRGGARVAAADVNGDGRPDIVVGAGYGGGPRVAIFDGATVTGTPRKLVNDFFAFGGADLNGLRNGIYVAAGDLSGDGRAELVFGGGPGGGPRVLVLDGAQLVRGIQAPIANFFAFEATERGGVRPAIKDLDNDGRADLVVASGERVPASVLVYTASTSQWIGGSPGSGLETELFGTLALADGVHVG